MKFFLPPEAEIDYKSIKEHISRNHNNETPSDKRIFSIQYKHDGKVYYAEVGKIDDYMKDTALAIFELERMFVIETKGSALGQANPIWVGKDDLMGLIEFDN